MGVMGAVLLGVVCAYAVGSWRERRPRYVVRGGAVDWEWLEGCEQPSHCKVVRVRKDGAA